MVLEAGGHGRELAEDDADLGGSVGRVADAHQARFPVRVQVAAVVGPLGHLAIDYIYQFGNKQVFEIEL